MTSELQDRIAVAISGAPFPTANSRRKALAVMKALREPTEVMEDAADQPFHDAWRKDREWSKANGKPECHASASFFNSMWRAALDAEISLAEGGPRDRD